MTIDSADTASILVSAAVVLMEWYKKRGYRIKGDIVVKVLRPTG